MKKFNYEITIDKLTQRGIDLMALYYEYHKEGASEVVKGLIRNSVKSRYGSLAVEDIEKISSEEVFMAGIMKYKGCLTPESMTASLNDASKFFIDSVGAERYWSNNCTISDAGMDIKRNLITIDTYISFGDIMDVIDESTLDDVEEFVEHFIDAYVRKRIVDEVKPQDLKNIDIGYTCHVGCVYTRGDGTYAINLSYKVSIDRLTDSLAKSIMAEIEELKSKKYY